MNITLYKVNEMYNVVGKTLANGVTVELSQLNCNLDEEFPVFVFKALDVSNYNYAVFNGFHYFLAPPRGDINGLVYVTGQLDYLEQFKDDIKNLTCYVTRSNFEESYVPNEVDTLSVESEVFFDNSADKFDDSEEGGTYVLVTAQDGYDIANGGA